MCGTGYLSGGQAGWAIRIQAEQTRPRARLFTTFPTKQGIKTFKAINCMATTRDSLWFGTDQGLLSYQPATQTWTLHQGRDNCGGFHMFMCEVSPIVAALWADEDTLVVATKANSTVFRSTYHLAKVYQHQLGGDRERLLFLWEQIGSDTYETVAICAHSDTIWLLERPVGGSALRGTDPWLVRFTENPQNPNLSTFDRFLAWPNWTSKDRPKFTSMVCDQSGTIYLGTENAGLIRIGPSQAKEKGGRFWIFQSYAVPTYPAIWTTIYDLEGGENVAVNKTLTVRSGHLASIAFGVDSDHDLVAFEIQLFLVDGSLRFSNLIEGTSEGRGWSNIEPGTYTIRMISSNLSPGLRSSSESLDLPWPCPFPSWRSGWLGRETTLPVPRFRLLLGLGLGGIVGIVGIAGIVARLHEDQRDRGPTLPQYRPFELWKSMWKSRESTLSM